MADDLPIIDKARLDLVCMGDAAFAAVIIDSLIEEATPILEALPKSLTARDQSDVRQQAHALKGIAGNVGAARLQAAAAVLERGAIDGLAWDALAQHFDLVSAALAEVRAERERGV